MNTLTPASAGCNAGTPAPFAPPSDPTPMPGLGRCPDCSAELLDLGAGTWGCPECRELTQALPAEEESAVRRHLTDSWASAANRHLRILIAALKTVRGLARAYAEAHDPDECRCPFCRRSERPDDVAEDVRGIAWQAAAAWPMLDSVTIGWRDIRAVGGADSFAADFRVLAAQVEAMEAAYDAERAAGCYPHCDEDEAEDADGPTAVVAGS